MLQVPIGVLLLLGPLGCAASPSTTSPLGPPSSGLASDASGNATDENTTTTTTTALLLFVPRTVQQEFCASLTPVMGLWYSGYLIVSTCILVVVVTMVKRQGMLFAMPRLAGLRYNLFGALWVQGLMGFLQAFREDGGDGCFVAERFLIAGPVPLPGGASRAFPLPRSITDIAFFVEVLESGYCTVMLLIAMPRMRMNFRPEGMPEPKAFCCIPGWACRRCGLLVLLLLIVVNPIVSVLTVRNNLVMSLSVEFAIFVTGVFLACVVARAERAQLSGLFEHIYLQEWSVLSAGVLTRIGKIAVASAFDDRSASFIIAFLSSFSVMGVLLYLVCATPPSRDPLLWLAGQEWSIRASLAQEPEVAKELRRRRRTVLRFFLSMVNFREAFQLTVMDEALLWFNYDVRLKEPETDEANELVLGRRAWAEWERWAEKVCSSWPGLRELYPVFVSGFPAQMTVQDLRKHFGRIGEVMDVKMVDQGGSVSEEPGAPNGEDASKEVPRAARVAFATEVEQANAVEQLNAKELGGKLLTVRCLHFQLNCSGEVTNVEAPTSLTSQEEALRREHKLTRFSKWIFVMGDLFSDRVHNQELGVLMLAGVAMSPYVWRFLTTDQGILTGIDPTVAILWQSMLFCFVVWLALAVALFGNNVFMPLCCSGHWGRRLWLIFIVVFSAPSLMLQALGGLGVAEGTNNVLPTIYLWFRLILLAIASAEISVAARLIFVDHMPQVRNTYHRLEFAAQRYCQKLLEGESRIAKVQRGHAYQILWGGSYRPCLVKEARADGTCLVVLQGGQLLSGVLTKDLLALDSMERLVRTDRDYMQAMWEDTVAPLVHSLVTGAGRAIEAVTPSAGRKDGNEKSNEERAKTPEGGGASAHAGEHVVQVGGHASDQEGAPKSGEANPARNVAEPPRVTAEEVERVERACVGGKKRSLQLMSQYQQAQGYRAFFNTSIGLSGLMLTSLLLGPVLVVLSGVFLGVQIMSFEHGITRMHGGAAYALRVQTLGWSYGACTPPTQQEHHDCVQSLAPAACVPPAEQLLYVFDGDKSGMLELGELDKLSGALRGISVAAATGGTEATSLGAASFRDLARQAARPGTDFLDESGLERFVCAVAQRIEARNVQALQALNAINNLQNVSAHVLFPLADINPQDGFLTEQELLALMPSGSLLSHLGQLSAGLAFYPQAVRIGFLLGDTQPADGRLSPTEADAAIAIMARLSQGLPRLAAEISAVQSGQKQSFDPQVLLDVLDLNGDGNLDRIEIGVLGMVVETATGNPAISRQALQIFDAVDGDGDGLIRQGDLTQMVLKLQNALTLVSSVASQDSAALAQALASVLDADQDGALSRTEFDNLAQFLPAQYSSQAPFVLNLVFLQADTSPTDGKLSGAEMEVAAQRIQAAVQQFSQAASGQQPLPPGIVRRLQEEGEEPTESGGRRLVDSTQSLDFAAELMGFGASTLIGEQNQRLIQDYLKRFLWVFNSEEFRIIFPLVIMGLRLSMLGAVLSACWMMLQTKLEHERLTQRIQKGKKDYVGSTQTVSLRNSFSVSTSFPGIFVATVAINFLIAFLVIFIVLVLVATPCVLLALPGTRPFVLGLLWLLRFPALAAGFKAVLKYLIVDKFIVEHGQPKYPQFFAPLWLVLILLNFVQAPFFAVFRWASLVVHATITSTYLHNCPVSESLMSIDPGYYAFIALTFTQSARRNLVRTCFISALMPQTQRARCPEPRQVRDKAAEEARARRLRIRNKLWVAVTLWNNPELRTTRRISKDREYASFITLWDGDGQPPSGEKARVLL